MIETIRIPQPIAYGEMRAVMHARWEAVCAGTAPDTLYLLEHLPVITTGRNFETKHLLETPESLARRGVALEAVDRGGDATYHGPGQLVAYPILRIAQWRQSLRWYLRALEEVLIRQLAGYGLDAGRVDGLTGVWAGGGKVAAIGVGMRKWVTYHGIALNVGPDLDAFRFIVPCGIADRSVTSLRELLGHDAPSMSQAMDDFDHAFHGFFGDPEAWQSLH